MSPLCILASGELPQTPMPKNETKLGKLNWQQILQNTSHINNVTTML
jgi:hypothetical protein